MGGAFAAAVLALSLGAALVVYQAYRKRNKRLYDLAYVDPVTGGYSPARFEAEALALIRAASPGDYMLVTVNLAGFKLVNDAFGSERGDATLRHMHRAILHVMDEGDLLCRTFADHFVLLVKTIPREEIACRMKMLSEELNRFNERAERTYYLVVSAGVYVIDDPSLSLVQMRDRSNVARRNATESDSRALYACGFYSDADRCRLQREKDLENRMGDLIESGELAVFLQPKLDVRTRQIAGAEALVRWIDPERGLVMPDDFIPFFEKNGFVARIDLFVFEQACSYVQKWTDAGVGPLPISVNLSRVHLDDPDFLAQFDEVRKRYAVSACMLDLELTETLVAKNMDAVPALVDRIRAAGYRCSIDDFGSGYSSLGMLKDVRADTLKLDREFLRAAAPEPVATLASTPEFTAGPGAPPGPCSAQPAQPAAPAPAADPRKPPAAPQPDGSPRASAVVESVVAMAKRLGMQVVCEGVESKEQLDQLAAMGCDLAQGFAVAPALPPAEFERMAFGRVVG
ncbi:putative bifunctional diguanylate cyclase/phosphodiesterase [Raoultibacter phocaeensis]|uniref:putative bifunctional diguanylate cyclase/phosphodiesterase n=1 Tax=Raoultibacter phocaeensis TaxID=2479841 RepID=UPI0015D5E87C|nr:bifunctional diguanylate cyclase/phosphodiesterase [Raoultibacter phocaeensis]